MNAHLKKRLAEIAEMHSKPKRAIAAPPHFVVVRRRHVERITQERARARQVRAMRAGGKDPFFFF